MELVLVDRLDNASISWRQHRRLLGELGVEVADVIGRLNLGNIRRCDLEVRAVPGGLSGAIYYLGRNTIRTCGK